MCVEEKDQREKKKGSSVQTGCPLLLAYGKEREGGGKKKKKKRKSERKSNYALKASHEGEERKERDGCSFRVLVVVSGGGRRKGIPPSWRPGKKKRCCRACTKFTERLFGEGKRKRRNVKLGVAAKKREKEKEGKTARTFE